MALTSIFGNAIVSGSELENVEAVPVTPPHTSRAVVQRPYGLFAATTERLYVWDSDFGLLSGRGSLKGIRLRAYSTDLDLSASSITVFQVCVVKGNTALGAHEIRDRSENINKSRLVANGDYFDLLFTDPPDYEPGDFLAIRCLTSSGFSFITNTAIHAYPLKASEFFGATTAASATYTDASASFQTELAVGDWATIYNGGNTDNYRHAQITSIASETSLDLTGTATSTGTGHDMVIGDHAHRQRNLSGPHWHRHVYRHWPRHGDWRSCSSIRCRVVPRGLQRNWSACDELHRRPPLCRKPGDRRPRCVCPAICHRWRLHNSRTQPNW